jgi:transcriptional regulator of arginine metabolism
MTERAESRVRRRKLLVELISRDEISSQNQLRKRLASLGFDVNQATLSRDLRELGIIKIPLGSTGSRYVVPGTETPSRRQYEETFRRLVLSVDVSGQLMVLKTGPGDAQAAALALDNMRMPEILGTVAGDDTFLAVVREDTDRAALLAQVRSLVGLPH